MYYLNKSIKFWKFISERENPSQSRSDFSRARIIGGSSILQPRETTWSRSRTSRKRDAVDNVRYGWVRMSHRLCHLRRCHRHYRCRLHLYRRPLSCFCLLNKGASSTLDSERRVRARRHSFPVREDNDVRLTRSSVLRDAVTSWRDATCGKLSQLVWLHRPHVKEITRNVCDYSGTSRCTEHRPRRTRSGGP